MKKGQNWSIEMIITTALFVAFFVIFISLSFFSNSTNLRDVEYVSDELALRLISENDHASIVDERNDVNDSRLLELSALSYDELKELFGITEDFCILLEDEGGNVIPINGSYGIGSDDILISGVACNGTVSLP